MNNVEFFCQSCGANWTKGNHTPECKECGGGALTKPCIICEGKCGNTWKKMPLDSNDSRLAHWGGSCGLPEAEKFKLIQKKIKE